MFKEVLSVVPVRQPLCQAHGVPFSVLVIVKAGAGRFAVVTVSVSFWRR